VELVSIGLSFHMDPTLVISIYREVCASILFGLVNLSCGFSSLFLGASVVGNCRLGIDGFVLSPWAFGLFSV